MIELAQVYRGVNHHHIYQSIDCVMKINSKLYSDSIIGKKSIVEGQRQNPLLKISLNLNP
jgi:hypothetical protein